MRKKNQEIKDHKTIEKILSKSKICRIAMWDDETPYILPFNYGYRDQTIYIHSAPEGKKIDLLKKNNKVCFEIEYKADIIAHDQPCKWATTYQSVVGYGEVEIVTDYVHKKEGLDIIMSHNNAPDQTSYIEKQINAMVILKLHITRITAKQSSNWSNE